MNLLKLLSALALMIASLSTYAQIKDQSDLRFKPDTKNLIKGEIHYAMTMTSTRKFSELFSDFVDFDSLQLQQQPKSRLMLAKIIYIVNKPIGFFDHQNVIEEKFVAHTLQGMSVKKLTENKYKVQIPNSHSYEMTSYFDSDDISTLPNSKVIRAVTQARKLDVIAGSAPAIIFREFTAYTKYSAGGVQVSSFIPLKENKTMVVSYTLQAVKKYAAVEKLLRESLIAEALEQKKLIESYP